MRLACKSIKWVRQVALLNMGDLQNQLKAWIEQITDSPLCKVKVELFLYDKL